MADPRAAGAPTPGRLTVAITGQIKAVSRKQTAQGESWRTLVRTPAPDPYSSPATYELRSKRRLGQEGGVLEVTAELIGYSRSYETKEGDRITTAEHVLQVE